MDATVDFEKNGKQLGHLKIPHSVHRSAYGHIPIPVAVLKNGVGPTALLVGGVHGDEYEGPVAFAKFVQRVELSQIQGRVIVVPAMNFPAFLAATRVSPIDGINLNRTFPGRRDGSVTEVIAEYVTRVLLPLCDFVFDAHAGGSSLQYLPSLLSPYPGDGEDGETLRRIIRAMRPQRTLYFDGTKAMSGEDRVLSSYAHKNGAIYLCGEFGGGSTVSPTGLRMVQTCVARFLQEVGILMPDGLEQFIGAPGQRDDGTQCTSYAMDDAGLFLYARHRGIFEPTFQLGDTVQAGDVAGYIYSSDDPWQRPEALHFESSGVALCVRTFAQVEPGDCLGHLGRPL